MDGYSICVPADVSRLCCIYATTQSLRVWEMGLCLCDVSGRLRSKLAHCLMTVTAANNGAHKGMWHRVWTSTKHKAIYQSFHIVLKSQSTSPSRPTIVLAEHSYK